MKPETTVPTRNSPGSVSSKIQLFENKISPEKRAPSPGMRSDGSSVKKRAPSPGGVSPLRPISNRISNSVNESPRSASPKRRPLPGGSMVPPSPSKMKTPSKPSPDGFSRRQPSPGRNRDSSPRRPPSPGRVMERIEPKRFVFSKEGTGVTPTAIHIASDTESPNISPQKMINLNDPQHQSLGMKNQNPLRNNSQFLQRMTEAIDSDDETGEHDHLGDKSNFREIAQLAAVSELPRRETEEHPNQFKIVGGPLSKENEQSALGGDTSVNKIEQDKFAHPAKHWVNLRPTAKIEKEVQSSDALVQKIAIADSNVPAVPAVPASDASVSSTSDLSYAKRLTPKKKAVVEKLREVRGRQARTSVSPPRRSRKDSNDKSRNLSQSPSRGIIKPSPIRASNVFFPIKRNDDSSVSSYSIKSFSSTISGKDSKRGGSLTEKVKRASTSSPMRYKPFEEGVKTNNSSDDNMSVKKGLNLIHAQNQLLRNVDKNAKKNESSPKPKQSFSRLNSNLARLKVLKEEKKLRDEQLEKQRAKEEAVAPKFHYMSQLQGRRGQGSSNVMRPKVADDEFTVDAEVLQINGESESTESSDEQAVVRQIAKKKDKNDEKPKHHSQWAVIMQNRLSEVSDEESSSFEDEFQVEDEFQNDGGWDADTPEHSQNDGNNHSQIQSNGPPSPSPNNTSVESSNRSPLKTPDHMDMNKHESNKITPRRLGHEIGESNIKNDSDEFNHNFEPPVKQIILTPKKRESNSVSVRGPEEPLDQHPIPPIPHFQNEEKQINHDHISGSINPYIGPFEHLLPRSSNPWIIRINPPTMSSSLTTFRSIQPPPIIPSYESNHLSQVQNSHELPASVYPQYPGIGNLGQYPMNGNFGVGNIGEQVQYPTNGMVFGQSQHLMDTFPSAQTTMKPTSRGGKSLALSNSTTESGGLNNPKVKNGSKKSSEEASTLIGEASTLIGQEHILSNDSDTLSKEESLSRWWENNYAASQDKDVNDMIKKALSKMDENILPTESDKPSKDNASDTVDSDDDVFSGLESPRDQPTKRKSKKSTYDKELDTILSADETNEEKKTATKISNVSLEEKEDHSKFSGAKQENQEQEQERHDEKNPESKDGKKQLALKELKEAAKVTESYNVVNVASSESSSQDHSKKSKRKKNSSTVQEEKEQKIEEEIAPIGRVSSRLASKGSFLSAYTCGILDPVSSSSNRKRRSKDMDRRHTRDDDTYDDNTHDGTYYTNDNTAEYSSRSGSIGSHTNASQTYDSKLHLSERERKVWDAWDRKDNESFAGASMNDTQKGKKELQNERRSRAHEKLLMHAYIALSKPPPTVLKEKGEAQESFEQQQHSISENQPQNQTPFPNVFGNSGEFWQPGGQQPFNENQGQGQPIYSQSQDTVPENQFSDSENQAPQSFISHENISFQPSVSVRNDIQDAGSLPSTVKQQSVESIRTTPSKVVPAPLARKQKSLAYQKHVLEKFCVRVKHTGVEVLKLNREKKWQTRYLTVSKEGTWLKNSDKGDSCFCPLGLLWVKKFNKSKEHSVLTIDKQGKGGMLLANLVQVKIQDDYERNSTLTKKQLERYHDSLIIHLHAASSFVTFRCERNDADAIIIGCNAIIDVLRGSNTRKLMRPRSEPKRSQAISDGVPNNISKTYVANDLWEA